MTVLKITIKAITETEQLVDRWLIQHDKKEFDSQKEPQYAYVTHKERVTLEADIYEQTVHENNFDLEAVIRAINRL
jgi:hypothetical protein